MLESEKKNIDLKNMTMTGGMKKDAGSRRYYPVMDGLIFIVPVAPDTFFTTAKEVQLDDFARKNYGTCYNRKENLIGTQSSDYAPTKSIL